MRCAWAGVLAAQGWIAAVFPVTNPPMINLRHDLILLRSSGVGHVRSTVSAKAMRARRQADPNVAMVRWILRRMTKGERDPPGLRAATQLANLHKLLAHAQREVPFYTDRLRSAGFRADRPLTEEIWQKLQIVRRGDVQCDQDSLTARNVPGGHGPVRESVTTGSTGTPLRVLKTGLSGCYWDAITAREMLWHRRDRSLPWHSIRYMDSKSAIYPSGLKASSWGRVANILGETGPGYGLHITTDPSDQVEWLLRKPPSYLLTYPSNLKDLLQITRSLDRPFPTLRQIVTVGESLAEGLREQCLDQWGARICDIYSASEVGYIAIQAPNADHYLVPDEVIRVELVDDEGKPVPVGESGRVIVTPLHSFAMPLIRYEVGDYATRGGTSPCGRTLPVIDRINGRVRNMLTYPDGTRSWPLFPSYGFRDLAPVRQFRVIQETRERLILQVASDRVLSESERTVLIDALRSSVGYPFSVTLTEHDRLERGAGGKYEDFRSELPPR